MAERKKWSATVSARLLLAIAPFRDLSAVGWMRAVHAIQIEPCSGGGVLLIATDGHAMGVAYDRTGVATGPMAVALPPALIEACRPPKVPSLWTEGEMRTPKAPAWMIPNKVFLSDYFCAVMQSSSKTEGFHYDRVADTGSVHREDDYRLVDSFPEWRRVLPTKASILADKLNFNPANIAKFETAASLVSDYSGPDGLVLLGQEDANGPVVVRCRTFPDFWGCFMPMSAPQDAMEAFPDWLAADHAAALEG